MAKTGKKASTKTKAAEAATPAPETQEKIAERQINLLVKTDNISDRTTQVDGKDKSFKSCRIPVMIDGETKFASMAVDNGRVKPATKPIKDEKGEIVRDDDGKAKTEPIEGYSNVWLRGEKSTVKLNVQDGKDDKGNTIYKDMTFTAGEVKDMNDAAKKAYKDSQKNAQKTGEREVPDAGLEAPEAESQVEL